MSETGVQTDGSFVRKYIDAIQEDRLEEAEQHLENFDPARGSPDRQRIDFASIEIADQWEALEALADAPFLDTATGVQLDRLLAFAGFHRLGLRGATGEVTFLTPTGTTNSQDIPIDAGTIVTTRAEEGRPAIPFVTTADALIEAGEELVTRVPIRAAEPTEPAGESVPDEYLGARTNLAAETITQIADPIAGVSDVVNPLPTGKNGIRPNGEAYAFVSGRDRERDSEFRTRYRNSLAKNAKATLDAIETSAYEAGDGSVVRGARAEENNSPTVDEEGRPPKSVHLTVVAPDTPIVDDQIAQALYETRSAGIESYGATSGTAERLGGRTSIEHFDRASEVTVYVDATVVILPEEYPSDGEQRITDRIVGYIGGENTTGSSIPGLNIGHDVEFDQAWGDIICVPGVERFADGGELRMGTAPDATSSSSVAIADDEQARVYPETISINTTPGERR